MAEYCLDKNRTFVKNGKKTGSLYQMIHAFDNVLEWEDGEKRTGADYTIAQFTNVELREVLDEMEIKKHPKTGRPWTINYVNTRLEKILAVFQWGNDMRKVSDDKMKELKIVKPFELFSTNAAPNKPVIAVRDKYIKAAIPFMPPTV